MQRLWVHGGVSGVAHDQSPSLQSACEFVGNALDAVEQAIRVLEDVPGLNAGYGAVLNRDGRVELDAGIADGTSGHFGGVAGVEVAHPISLARRVLEETPHALITGPGAALLGADMEQVVAAPEQIARWERAQSSGEFERVRFASPEHVDTVGAVALDEEGNLAAASSTGGIFGKLPGRMSDAPVFGAGIYAWRRSAVVGTGVGELFLRTLACREVGRLIENGSSPQEACSETIESIGKIERVPAGLLAIDDQGRVGAAYRGAEWQVAGLDGPLVPHQLQ